MVDLDVVANVYEITLFGNDLIQIKVCIEEPENNGVHTVFNKKRKLKNNGKKTFNNAFVESACPLL
jgi:hypothetical protein